MQSKNLVRFFGTSAALGVLTLGLAGAGHAQTITLGVNWLASGVNGTTPTGKPLITLTGTNSTVSQSISLGQTKTFTFAAPISILLDNQGGAGAVGATNSITSSSTMNFQVGAGSTGKSFSQTFNGQQQNGGVGVTGTYSVTSNTAAQSLVVTNGGVGYRFTNVTLSPNAGAGFNYNGAGGTFTATPSFTVNATFSSVIPEPATLALLGLGLVPVAAAIRRRRK